MINSNPYSKVSYTQAVGSIAYQSPQLLLNKPYSVKADIWAAGVTMYQLLFNFDLPFGNV